mmetsp:Transcript_7985/g.15242  ORF Transcript_7985/g.15242 Transcript_7985/m.15242 type:complete len:372 (-) Transcript_7985:3087-4202(-)
MLVVVCVQEHGSFVMVVLLTGFQQLRDVQLAVVHLAVLKQLLLLVLAVHDAKLGVDSSGGTVQVQPLLQQLDNLVKVTPVLVVINHTVQVVDVPENVNTTKLGEAEFACIHTSKANFFPSLHVGSFLSSVHSSLEVTEFYEAHRELGVIVNVVVQDFGSMEQVFCKASVAAVAQLGNVTTVDEFFQFGKAVGLSEDVNHFTVHDRILQFLASHLNERHQFVVVTCSLGNLDNLSEIFGLVSFHIRLDGVRNEPSAELRLGEDAPHLREFVVFGTFDGTGNRIFDVVQKYVDGFWTLLEFFVNEEGFFVQLCLGDGVGCHLRAVIIVKLFGVAHNPVGAVLNGSQNKQVLKVFVGFEFFVVSVEDDALKKLD